MAHLFLWPDSVQNGPWMCLKLAKDMPGICPKCALILMDVPKIGYGHAHNGPLRLGMCPKCALRSIYMPEMGQGSAQKGPYKWLKTFLDSWNSGNPNHSGTVWASRNGSSQHSVVPLCVCKKENRSNHHIVQCFLHTADKGSTSNMWKHAWHCWGDNIIKKADKAGEELTNDNIQESLARAKREKMDQLLPF